MELLSVIRKRSADPSFFGAGGGAIVGAVGGSDTCRFQSIVTCPRARARLAQRLEIFTGAGTAALLDVCAEGGDRRGEL
jgi:hypothetical protein